MKKTLLMLVAILTGFAQGLTAATPGSGAARVCNPPKVSMPEENLRIPGIEDLPVCTDGFARQNLDLPIKKLPRRLVREGEMLMAYSLYNNSGFTKGINRLDFTGTVDFLWADDYVYRRYIPTTGYMRNGRLCYFTKYQIFTIDDYRFLVVDPYTGKIYDDRKVPLYDEVTGFDNYLPLYTAIAYNSDEDMVYGYSSNEAGSGYSFLKAPGSNPAAVEIILDKVEYANVCASICYNEKEKALYGINRNNDFVKIDFDGTQTVVMPMGVRTMWSRAALMYVADEDYYLWNCQLTDGTTGLWCIDPANNQVSSFIDFQSEGALPMMFFGEIAKDPRGIAKPIIDVADFGLGLTDGTVSYFIPSTRFDGKEITGNLDWTAYLDDEPYATGTAAAGSKVTVEFKGIERGAHYFSFEVSNETLKSPMADKKLFIGFDNPMTPENVVLDEHKVTWDKVVRGANGGYVDIDNLVYHVYINDKEVGVTADNEFSLGDSLTDGIYAGYVAKVVADNNGFLSEVSKGSDIVIAGKPCEIPFHITPTREEAQAFTAIDVNQDGNTWSCHDFDDFTSFVHPLSSYDSGCDDWLFSPPVNFSDLTTDYEISIDIANRSEWYREESVSIWLCTEINPNCAIKKLIDYQPKADDYSFNRISQVFAVPEPGIYYIAFYVKSEPSKRGIFLKELDVVKTGVSSPRPSEVENIFCQGGPEAALYVDVEFDIPTTFLSGEQIPADTEIEVEVTAASTEVVKGKPGETISVRVDAVQGSNLLSIVPFYDGYAGHRSDVNVYCGYDIPGEVQNLTAYVSEDNLRLHMKWDPPTTVGENGYYVDPAQCGYRVYQNTENGWTVVADLDCDTREYALSVAPDNGLRSEWAGVVPVNVAGESPSMPWMSDMLGSPYELPMEETFTDASLDYPPVRILRITDPEGYTNWTMTNPKSVNDAFANDTGICLMGNTEKEETIGILMLPKFSTKGLKEAMLRLNIWTGLGMPYVTILGEVWDNDTKFEIGRVFVGDGWTDFRFDLPEKMLDREWVALYIMATYPTTNYFVLISNYGITEESTDGVEGVIDATSGRYVRGLTGRVAVDGYEGLPVTVSSLDGKVVSSVAAAPESHIIPLTKGIYIVNAGGEAHKVMVK